MTAAALSVQIVSDPNALAGHRRAWDSLVETVPAFTGAQTFAYMEAGWRNRGTDAESLNVILAYAGSTLIAAWPLHVVRFKGLRIARHLGCGGREEYAEPLIADVPERAEAARAIYAAASGLADVLEVHNLSAGSPIRPLIEAERRPLFRTPMSSPTIASANAGSLEAWVAGKSKSFRSGLRQDRKRLTAQGVVQFREVDAAGSAAFVDWVFARKRQWLDEQGIGANWLRNDGAAQFFGSLVGREGSGVQGFVLELDGRPVAGCICLLSAASVEFYVTAMEPAYAAYSPGNLLIEDLLRWSIERRLDFDFRLTREAYKLRWSDSNLSLTTYYLACAGRGGSAVRRLQRQAAVTALKQKVRSSLGPLGRFLPRRKR